MMSDDGTQTFRDLLEAADQRRQALADETEAYRLFHGWSEGLPGLAIDRWSNVFTVEARDATATRVRDATLALVELYSPAAVVAKIRGNSPELVYGEEPGTMTVVENGIRFLVDPARPRNPGLYTDARDARAWIRQHSRDMRVLNLFAFTGSLGLAASVGGARSVSHVDMQRSALDRIRENYRVNDLIIDDRDLLRLNLYHHLRRQSAQRRRYDAIIIDAPPYSPRSDRTPGKKGVFALARLARNMLAPGGWMMCFFHHYKRPLNSLESDLEIAVGDDSEVIWRGSSGTDYPEEHESLKSRMIAVRATR